MPHDPNCTDGGIIGDLVNRTFDSITLNLSYYEENNEEHVCVKVMPFGSNSTCRSINGSYITFGSLTSSTQYNFSVFSYINTSSGIQLLSNSSCPLLQYTCKYIRFNFD